MNLVNKYGNNIVNTDDERKIQRLLDMGYKPLEVKPLEVKRKVVKNDKKDTERDI